MSKIWVDPPEGWKYGFPKQTDSNNTNFRKWLIENGYPEKVINEYGDYFHMRMWDVEEND